MYCLHYLAWTTECLERNKYDDHWPGTSSNKEENTDGYLLMYYVTTMLVVRGYFMSSLVTFIGMLGTGHWSNDIQNIKLRFLIICLEA